MSIKSVEYDKQLLLETDPERIIDLKNQLAYEIRREDRERSEMLSKESYEAAKTIGYKKGLSESLHLLAIHNNLTGDYHGTLEKCDEALVFMEELNDIPGKIKVMNSKGYAYARMGKGDLGLEFFLKGLELSKSIEDDRMAIFFLTNIGDTYASIMNMHKEALKYFFEAFELCEEKLKGNHELHGSLLMYIAESYRELGELDQSMEYAKKGLIKADLTKDRGYEAHCNHVFGKALLDKGEREEAEKHLNRGLEIYRQGHYKYNQAELLYELADLKRKSGRFEESILDLEESLEIAVSIEAIPLECTIHQSLAEIFEQIGVFESSILHYKEYILIHGKLTSELQEKKLNAIIVEQKLEQAKKDAEIYRLRNVELRESYSNIEAISEIGRRITGTQEIERIIDTIYNSLRKRIACPTFGLGLYDKYTETMEYRVFIEKEKPIPRFVAAIDAETSFAAKCIREKEPFVCNDLSELAKNTHFKPLENADFDEEEPQSVAYIPLVIENEVIGAYTVQSYIKNAYSPGDIEVLNALAPFIAIGINNWQKTEELKTAAAVLSETLEHLKATQDYLVDSEKMAALGQLISGVAHEINTPLGAIQASINNISDYTKGTIIEKFPALFHMLSMEEYQLFVQMLRQTSERSAFISVKDERALKKDLIHQLRMIGVEDSYGMADNLVDMGIYGDIERYLPIITSPNSAFILQVCYEISGILRNANNMKEAIAKASKMIFALRNYAHFDHTNKPTEEDVTKGLETVLSLYHNNIKHGVELVRSYGEIPRIPCFPDELNQVWTNLIHNALQAMDYSGRLEIRTSRDAEWVTVEIIDDGVGIAEEIRGRIFEPFFTTKGQGEGSGLGLGIAKKIIEKHHGEIDFFCDEKETRFIVKLPIETPAEKSTP